MASPGHLNVDSMNDHNTFHDVLSTANTINTSLRFLILVTPRLTQSSHKAKNTR